jgi:hypothetical protein
MTWSHRAVKILVVFGLFLASCSLGSSTSVFDLKPGDCFDEPSSLGEITDLQVVDCADPHDYEAFGAFDVADGPFPGEDALDDAAFACVPLFEDYVGSSYEDTPNLDIAWLAPTAESWSNGDRSISCSLYDIDGDKLTGSQRDTGA